MPEGWPAAGGAEAGFGTPGALGGTDGAPDGIPGGLGAPGKLGGFGMDGADGG
jgi:hypothetical protein